MIVNDSDLVLQALDRRLQVDRVLALDPLKAFAGTIDEEAPTTAARPNAAAGASAGPSAQSTLMARLPLGRVVSASVVEITDADHLVAEVEQWRVTLAWPSGAGPSLLPGQQINLRVLAHQPMLLFQNVDAAGEAIEDDDSTAAVQTRWSQNAIQLSRQSSDATTRGSSDVARFSEPILRIRIVPDQAAALDDRIALDDVILGHDAAPAATPASRPVADAPNPALSLPVVLQGPAWPGQAMELVVRRERGDEALDNPALDAWCGDITIDLPTLGRVSGSLSFSMQGLRIRLEGDDALAVASMHEASALLAAALADADLRVQSLSIGQAGSADRSSVDGDPRSAFANRG